jgi:hypothetical protein
VSALDSPLTGWGLPGDADYLEPLNIHTNIYAASLVVKTGPGRLYGLAVYSSSASAQWIQVFDAATLPADGAIPAAIFRVNATSNIGVQWLPPRTFYTGCVVCNSSTGPTKTIGSADCWIDAQYV